MIYFFFMRTGFSPTPHNERVKILLYRIQILQ
jgi:hypothetical protein